MAITIRDINWISGFWISFLLRSLFSAGYLYVIPKRFWSLLAAGYISTRILVSIILYVKEVMAYQEVLTALYIEKG